MADDLSRCSVRTMATLSEPVYDEAPVISIEEMSMVFDEAAVLRRISIPIYRGEPSR